MPRFLPAPCRFTKHWLPARSGLDDAEAFCKRAPQPTPEIRITTTTYSQVDTRLAFGHVAEPGTYMTTVTRPDLFGNYLTQQIGLLIQNHGVPVYVGPSDHADPGAFRRAERCRGAGAAGGRDGLPAARRVRRAGPAIDP
jgi:hypothetical protein